MKIENVLNSTKREILATNSLLQDWGLLNDLTDGEKERLFNQLEQIAASAVNDYKNSITELGTSLYSELTK